MESTTTANTPSTASSTAIDDAKATEHRLYQASLILEWQLYDDLLARHRHAVARFQGLTNEATALREENALLRTSNEDLKRRIVSRLLSATRSTSSNRSLSPPIGGFLPGDRTCEEVTSMRSAQSGNWRRNAERSSLPRSISVRSTGFTKIDQISSDNLTSAMEHKIVTMNRKMQKEEEEVGLTSVEVDAYYQGTFKTELCSKWQETGACPYRDHCQFAHGLSEIRPVLRHPRFKTEVCRMVAAGVPCPYGHRCHFRHSLLRPQDS